MKYLWQLYYWMWPSQESGHSSNITQFCRKEGVMWQDVSYDRSRWNNNESKYW